MALDKNEIDKIISDVFGCNLSDVDSIYTVYKAFIHEMVERMLKRPAVNVYNPYKNITEKDLIMKTLKAKKP